LIVFDSFAFIQLPHKFQPEGVLALLAEAKKHSQRDWLMCCVAFLHALRAHEVVGGIASWKNKKTGEKVVARYPGLRASNVIGTKLVVKRLKNSNPVEDELIEHGNPLLNERQALIELCRSTPANQRLFPISARTFQRRMHTYGEAAGLPELHCHPHTLKHSMLSYLRTKMDLDELQDRSGHKSLDSLKIYEHLDKAAIDGKVSAALASIGV
jgi:site-specific recombinase XerC